jgi:hypothetical protein
MVCTRFCDWSDFDMNAVAPALSIDCLLAYRRPGAEPIEIWSYPKDAPAGLHGLPPQRAYAFQRVDGLTRLVPVPPPSSRLPGAVHRPD